MPIGLHCVKHICINICECIMHNMYKDIYEDTHTHTQLYLQSCHGWDSIHLDFKKFIDYDFYGPTASVWKKYNAVNFQLLIQFSSYAIN